MNGAMFNPSVPHVPIVDTIHWVQANLEGLAIGAVVAVALVVLMLICRVLGQRMMDADIKAIHWRGVIGRVLARTSIWFMIVAAADIVASYTAPPERIAHTIDILFTIAAALQAATWARELALGVIAHRIGEDAEASSLGNAMSIMRVLISIAVFAIATILILDNIGVNVTALVAGLGVGGIAIGLAAQGIFADLFAALSILFDKPFKRGDTIQYDQTTGRVERIGLKTTRLRSLTGEQVVMANTKLLEREIHNFTGGRIRRSSLPFGLIYQTALEDLEKVPSLAKAAVESRKGCNFVRCAILAFGASSIDFELIFDCGTSDPNKAAADRSAVAIAILRTFAEHGLQFAYPAQTTFTAAPDGSLIMPYAMPSGVTR